MTPAFSTARFPTVTGENLSGNAYTLRGALDIPSDDTIYALLVGRDGTVHWRTAGRRTDDATAELRVVLDDLA